MHIDSAPPPSYAICVGSVAASHPQNEEQQAYTCSCPRYFYNTANPPSYEQVFGKQTV